MNLGEEESEGGGGGGVEGVRGERGEGREGEEELGKTSGGSAVASREEQTVF